MSYALKVLFFASILVLSGSVLPFTFAQNTTVILSPLKQLENGISGNDIKCKDGFVLIAMTDHNPVCVKPMTANKLLERNWVLVETSKSYNMDVTRVGPLTNGSSLILGSQPAIVSNQTLMQLPTIKKAIIAADSQYDSYQVECNSNHACPVTSGTIPPPTVFTGIDANEAKLAMGVLDFNPIISKPSVSNYGTNVEYDGKEYSLIIVVYS